MKNSQANTSIIQAAIDAGYKQGYADGHNDAYAGAHGEDEPGYAEKVENALAAYKRLELESELSKGGWSR